MNMDQLFDALPDDLQWEILSEFVGSHAVRKGKLIKRIVADERHKMLLDMPRIYPYVGIENDVFNFNVEAVVYRSKGRYLVTGKSKITRRLYGFRRMIDHATPSYSVQLGQHYMDDTVELPPFEKHLYPSYKTK
jgi:hypothetical protein